MVILSLIMNNIFYLGSDFISRFCEIIKYLPRECITFKHKKWCSQLKNVNHGKTLICFTCVTKNLTRKTEIIEKQNTIAILLEILEMQHITFVVEVIQYQKKFQ